MAGGGSLPRPPSGLVVWGTAAMRTAGDDVAEALALLGVRPVWAEESGRVVGLEPIPLAELGRPRVDVTLRISGFFRDAFPHLRRPVRRRRRLVAALDEARRTTRSRRREPTIPHLRPPSPAATARASCRSSSSATGAPTTTWPRSTWPGRGWAYGRRGDGRPAGEAMRRRFAAIEVAVKNQDNREHDIFDSDDYLQDHGGMVATDPRP